MKLGYARVSTTDQQLAIQRTRLHEAGCEKLFEEKISGARKKRPVLERLLSELRADDVVVVTRLDRLARSTSELLRIAEFERSLIAARTEEGRRAAQARGVPFGRPPKLRPDQRTLARRRARVPWVRRDRPLRASAYLRAYPRRDRRGQETRTKAGPAGAGSGHGFGGGETHRSRHVARSSGKTARDWPGNRLQDRRCSARRTVCALFPCEKWHAVVGDPPLAAAILDRLVHSACQINLKGESMRKRRRALTQINHRGS